MSQPDCIVAGAPRTGTTSLHACLRQHPQLWVPPQKEVQTFALPHLLSATGPGDRLALDNAVPNLAAYRKLFRAKGNRIAVEFSPAYFPHADCAESIRETLGPVRVILLLRHPVRKAYSQFCHLSRRHLETLSFKDALLAEPHRTRQGWGDMWKYRDSMAYTARVSRFREVFGSERVHVILAEEWFGKPQDTLDACLNFLGVTPLSALPHPHLGKSGYPRRRWAARWGNPEGRLLSSLYRASPGLFRTVRGAWERWNEGPAPAVPPDLAQRLWRETETDRQALAQLLGRPLPWQAPLASPKQTD